MKSLFCLLMAISVELAAVQQISMDHRSLLQVNLSYRNHNRIGIVGDRIKKAFFKSSNMSVEMEEDTGQIFVQALTPGCPPTTLSLISATGNVQDMELRFSDCPSEIVFLEPMLESSSMPFDEGCCDGAFAAPIEEEEMKEIVEGFIKGVLPEGYVSVEDQESPTVIEKGLKQRRVSRLIGNKQIVFVYRLQNDSCKVKTVTECMVNILDGDWVFLDRYSLKPRECALVLIGCLR